LRVEKSLHRLFQNEEGDEDQEDGKYDEKDQAVISLHRIGKMLTSKDVMRGALRGRGMKFVKAKKGSRTGDEYTLSVLAAIATQTSGAGAYSTLFGSALAALSADYSTLASLFDTVRCRRMHVHFEPVAGCSTVTSSGTSTLVHVPAALCVDDDAIAPIAFSSLTLSRDFGDKRNLYTATYKGIKHSGWFKPSFNAAGTTPSASIANMASWQDVNSFPTATGGTLFAIQTNALNNVQTLGTVLIRYELEWSTRL